MTCVKKPSHCTCPLQIDAAKGVFGKKNNMLNAYSNIKAVDLGLKPAWLCDGFAVKVRQIEQMLSLLELNKFITPGLIMLSFGEDVLVACKNALVQRLENALHSINRISKYDDAQYEYSDTPMSEVVRFVILMYNGKQDLHLPANIISSLKHNLATVLSNLNNSSQRCINIELSDTWLTPSMFGIALGYPVVYVLEGEDVHLQPLDMMLVKVEMRYSADMLSCPLHRMTVGNAMTSLVYSFSVPLTLYESVKVHVVRWCEVLVNKCTELDMCCTYNTTITYSSHVVL